MKVFKINGSDYICAKTKEEAQTYYIENYGDFVAEIEDKTDDYIWAKLELDDLKDFFIKTKKEYKVKYKKKYDSLLVRTTYKELVEYNKWDSPLFLGTETEVE